MGCCISRPENPSLEHQSHSVQDKLIISQAPPTPNIPYSSKKISPISPPSPTSSTSSSICSFTCTTNSNSIASSSSLSTASSSLTSKDRSFSNDFLWSCYKENTHITRINSLKEATHSFIPTKHKAPSPAKPSLASMRQSPPQKKRVRSNSPVNLTRQKSFRKEVPERLNSSYNVLASGMLRSPSPSRRFNGENSLSKRMTGPKTNATHSHCVSSSLRKEVIKPASPNNSSRRLVHSGLRHRESCSYSNRVNGSKIDETMVEEVVSNNDVDQGLNLMEDIDNPLVSFDCFIFL